MATEGPFVSATEGRFVPPPEGAYTTSINHFANGAVRSDGSDVDSVRLRLYHVDLPKLRTGSVVDFDWRSGDVVLADRGVAGALSRRIRHGNGLRGTPYFGRSDDGRQEAFEEVAVSGPSHLRSWTPLLRRRDEDEVGRVRLLVLLGPAVGVPLLLHRPGELAGVTLQVVCHANT